VLGGYASPVNAAYKKPGLVAPEHRLAMTALAFEDSTWITTDSWEMYVQKKQLNFN